MTLTDDINEILKYYQDQWIRIIDKYFPIIELTNKELEWRKKPWITKQLQNLISLKNKLYRKYVNKNSNIFWFNRYKAVKKEVEKLLFSAKKEFFKNYFVTNMNNSKKIWAGINEILNNKGRHGNTDIYLEENGSIITNQKTVANRFNKFYTHIAENLLKDLGKSPTTFRQYLKNPNEHSIFFAETDHGEIGKIISKLDSTKAGDIYGITPKFVKWAPGAAHNLSIIFNLAIEQGIFPHRLKIAKVIPIPQMIGTDSANPMSLSVSRIV